MSIGTIQALENGRGKLENLIAVLRELGAIDGIDAFLPEPRQSPLAMAGAKLKARSRLRASKVGKRKGNGLPSNEDGQTW